MSQGNQELPPIPEETQRIIDGIGKSHPEHAAAALQLLASRIYAVVEAVDRTYNVAAYLKKIVITPEQEGVFMLEIHDKDCGVPVKAIAEEVVEQSQGVYGKRLRAVVLGFDGGRHGVV